MHSRAAYWSSQFAEPKVHVVREVLTIVGEEGMVEMLATALSLVRGGDARSLGGAFMKIIKNKAFGNTTLYDEAKRSSGELDLETIRKREANKQKNIRERKLRRSL